MLKLFRNMLLMEVLVATVVIGIVATMLLSRLAYYQEMAEKANMEMTVAAVKSALRMRLAGMMLEGRAQEYPRLAEQNPMDWLEERPANYRGELPNAASLSELEGNWYFDRSARRLVYFVKYGANFKTGQGGDKSVSVRVILIYQPLANASESATLVTGAHLQNLHAYEWF